MALESALHATRSNLFLDRPQEFRGDPAHRHIQALSYDTVFAFECGLRQNEKDVTLGAQTVRRDDARPVRGLLGGKDFTGRRTLFKRSNSQPLFFRIIAFQGGLHFSRFGLFVHGP